MAKQSKKEDLDGLAALVALFVMAMYIISLYSGLTFLLFYPISHLIDFSFIKFALSSFVCYPLLYTIIISRQ
jgi:hypothetical protein